MGPLLSFGQPSLHSATVYVIDDDADTARLTAALLARDGYYTVPFTLARAFLENLPADDLTPRCLITDLCMPEMDGLQLQAALTARDFRLPIIFMTGLTEVPSAVQAMKEGAIDFMLKPVHLERLRGVVAAAIERDLAACERLLFRRVVEEGLEKLTPREREVLNLLALGVSSKQIGRSLGISVKTVFVHRLRVMEKMRVDSLVSLSQLMREYYAAGELAKPVTSV